MVVLPLMFQGCLTASTIRASSPLLEWWPDGGLGPVPYDQQVTRILLFFSSCRDGEDPIPAKCRRECHECDDSGRTFKQALTLQRHRKQMHEPVQCPTCNEEFQGTRALRSHRRSDHPNPLACEQCGRSFTLLHHLMRHLTTRHPAAPRQSGGGAAATPDPRNEPPNWRRLADPPQYTSLSESERSPLPIYRQKWAQIRTHFRRNNRLHDWYNFRVGDLQPATVYRHLTDIF